MAGKGTIFAVMVAFTWSLFSANAQPIDPKRQEEKAFVDGFIPACLAAWKPDGPINRVDFRKICACLAQVSAQAVTEADRTYFQRYNEYPPSLQRIGEEHMEQCYAEAGVVPLR